jgi:hypothetical protein
MGATTLGSILSGKIAHYIGAPNTFLLSGLGCIAALWYYNLKIKTQKSHNNIVLEG